MAIERMFLAVTPPPEVIDVISDLPTRPLRGVSFTRRNQWHVTVRFLGDCARHDALEALESLQAPAADVTIGPEVTLLGDRIVMVPVAGLDPVAAAVAEQFADVGEPSDRAFAGHLTLARLKGRPLRDPSMVSVIGAPISSTWAAESIELWKSELAADGATHTLVATQTLGA